MIISIILKFLIAHLIGDFLFQPDIWVKEKLKHKVKSKYLYFHILVHTVALLLIFQFQYLPYLVLIIISHYLVDLAKIYFTKKRNRNYLFILDQILHIGIILIVSYLIQPYSFPIEINNFYLLLVVFLILTTYTSSVIVKLIVGKWNKEVDFKHKSINGAGKFIGILERLFVFSFVLLDTWSAIGFLITAKSVFRFGDLNEGKNRKLTEYVLIGTLLSFGLAILLGITFNYLARFL